MPRPPAPRKHAAAARARNDPLHVQLLADASVELRAGARAQARSDAAAARAAAGDADGGAADAPAIDLKTSRRILDMVREQQDELRGEAAAGGAHAPAAQRKSKYAAIKEQRRRMARDSDDDDDDDDDEDGPVPDDDDDGDLDGDYEEFEIDDSGMNIDAGDQQLIEKFMNKEPKKQVNLSDLIMSKIQAANESGAVSAGGAASETPGLNPKVVEVYTKVGILLSRYRSGPLPKPFKIIPTLRDWEEVLFITRPDSWTPHAVYQATRIFVSNLKAKMAQRFFNLILVDRVRDEIQETKKLNYHLYMALKKALYKPGAFFKGFLLPICESGTCTLREAAIIGSVLIKVSVPGLHSAAALLKIAEMDYTGPNSLFIRILLDKKYALPFKVVDALVFHFLRFKSDPRELPVLWHQALLTFAQRYKEDLTADQKEALLDLLRHKSHEGITPEIRRELQNSVSRDEKLAVADEDVEMGVDF